MDPEAHRSSDLSQSRVEVRGIPHLPEPGRYPYFLYAVPKSATCAAFIKESRMKFLDANQLHRKYGGMGHPAFVTHPAVRAKSRSLLEGACACSPQGALDGIDHFVRCLHGGEFPLYCCNQSITNKGDI